MKKNKIIKKKVKNILLTNVGRRDYFVDFLLQIRNKQNLKIHLSDCEVKIPSFYLSNKIKYHITPPVKKNKYKYLLNILKIVKKNQIHLVIPLSDLDLEILSKNLKKFDKLNCFVAVSSFNKIDKCLNKKKLFYFCKRNNFSYPKLFFKKNSIKSFPVIKKDIKGSGSQGCELIKNKKKLNSFNTGRFIYQKFVEGDEYNIDIFNDLNGNYISCCAKKKLLMRAGETDRCEIIISKKIEIFSKKLSKSLRHIGNLDCDIIIDKNKRIFLVDLNPRFGGGYPFTHLAGLNYLSALIKILKGKNFYLRKIPLKIIGMKGISLRYFKKT